MRHLDGGNRQDRGRELGEARTASADDLRGIGRILFPYIRDAKTGEAQPEEVSTILQGIQDSLVGSSAHYFTIRAANNEVVGFAGYVTAIDPLLLQYAQTEKPAELNYIFTDLNRTGEGAGLRLLYAVEEDAFKRGCKELLVCSGEQFRNSWSFYDSHFGKPVDFIKDRYGGGEGAGIWRKALEEKPDIEELLASARNSLRTRRAPEGMEKFAGEEQAFSMEEPKQKFRRLAELIPDTPEVARAGAEYFGRMVADQLAETETPSNFTRILDMALINLDIGMNGWTGKPIPKNFAGVDSLTSLWAHAKAEEIVTRVFQQDFADAVLSHIEDMNATAKEKRRKT